VIVADSVTEGDKAASEKPAFRERFKTELREYSILAAYLYVSFTALAALKAAILQAEGIGFAPWAFAAVKAVVCAKFLLIGRVVGIGDGLARKYPLIISTLYRSLGFLIVLGLLTVLEELVIGYFRGESVVHSLGSMGGGTLRQFIATSVILLLILIPWFAFRALGEVIGDETLVRLYFEPRRKVDTSR
jgi:hypothetical protein